jgi:hypothetical protein
MSKPRVQMKSKAQIAKFGKKEKWFDIDSF